MFSLLYDDPPPFLPVAGKFSLVARQIPTHTHNTLTGILRKISFPFYTCESDCIKLIRLHYWPATSSKPLVAFTFHFLDWLEALLLECQVAVQDMTQAISYLIKDKIGQVYDGLNTEVYTCTCSVMILIYP